MITIREKHEERERTWRSIERLRIFLEDSYPCGDEVALEDLDDHNVTLGDLRRLFVAITTRLDADERKELAAFQPLADA